MRKARGAVMGLTKHERSRLREKATRPWLRGARVVVSCLEAAPPFGTLARARIVVGAAGFEPATSTV